jgi:hypothetical protein
MLTLLHTSQPYLILTSLAPYIAPCIRNFGATTGAVMPAYPSVSRGGPSRLEQVCECVCMLVCVFVCLCLCRHIHPSVAGVPSRLEQVFRKPNCVCTGKEGLREGTHLLLLLILRFFF